MSLPDIIASAFNLYIKNARVFLLLGLLGALLSDLEYLLLQWLGDALGLKVLGSGDSSQSSTSAGAVFLLLGTLLVSTALINVLADALVVPAAFEALLGRRPSPRAAWLIFCSSLPAMLLVWLVLSVGATLGITFVITIPLVIYWLVRVGFVIQVIVREGAPPRQALARSVQLVRGCWWRVLGVQVAILFLSALPGIVLRPLSSAFNNVVADYLFVGLAPWLALPFAAIARTLLYADIRLRKGEDLRSSTPVAS